MSEIKAELQQLKPRVSASVVWQSGRTTITEGEFLSLSDDKVYFESSFGAVEGDAMSMTVVEDDSESR